MTPPFLTRLSDSAAKIETILAGILNAAPDPPPPPRLSDAMRHAVLGGGKRFRPFLVVETARLFGGDPRAACRAGAAIELLHAYSLIHDDLPSMDNDDLRRGKPALHRAFDEATAILAGDALQALAFETLADPATHERAAIRAELVLLLARAAGMAGMVGGQLHDLEAEGRFAAEAPRLGEAAVRRLQAMKTGALIACAVESGAVIGGANPSDKMTLLAYGRALGAAFQIADDILDVESSAMALGKAAGKDATHGKATLVGALGLEEARAARDAAAAAAVAALAAFGPRADGLRQAACFAATRQS